MMLFKQTFIINNDIFERLDDLNKSYEYYYKIMEYDHVKLIQKQMRK